MTQLRCSELAFSHQGGFSLGPISHVFPRGLTSIVGENGAGKSTLFNLISGELRPNSGYCKLDGGAGVGYLPQSMQFPTHATVDDYLWYVAWLYGVEKRHRSSAVLDALESVGLLERRTSNIRTLSGGMRRRLGVAQAIVARPAALLLDEPTAGLDPLQRVHLRQLTEELARDHIVLMSTHLADDVSQMSDRILVLRDGALAFEGTSQEIEQIGAGGGIGNTVFERGLTHIMGAFDD